MRTLASRVLAAVVWCATIALPARGQEPARPAARDTTAQRDSIAPILPDTLKTPGAVLPVTREDICMPGYAKKIRNVPAAVKRRVYASYGITHREPGEYEVDHLISLELGGSNSIRNLWPQSFRTRPWNARVKDALENELHLEVCAGTLDLQTAQRDIAADWIRAYKKYFHTDLPRAAKRRAARRRKP